jgi:hypothetical protein
MKNVLATTWFPNPPHIFTLKMATALSVETDTYNSRRGLFLKAEFLH